MISDRIERKRPVEEEVRGALDWLKRKGTKANREGMALLWGLTVHDKDAGDAPFAKGLLLVERAATDERNFVKKAVNMALRSIGKRSPTLNSAAVKVAARWVGKDALRELTSPKVAQRLAKRSL